MAALSLLAIPIAAEIVLAEALFIGHIVFLVETLGFAWAVVVFAAIWAALGLAVLAAIDFLWPRIGPSVKPLFSRVARRLAEMQDRFPIKGSAVVLAVSSLLAAIMVTVGLIGSEIGEWIVDHPSDLGLFLVAALAVSAILIAMARLGRGLENWVRSMADSSGLVVRAFGALVSMMVLGPALSWPLFRLLRYSRRSVYALTLIAAPVFSGVWVPFYGLGVWGLAEGLL